MVVVTPTCKHTGSHFCFRYLFGHLPKLSINSPEWNANEGFYFSHLEDRCMPQIKRLMESYPAVVPLRHPLAVSQSHTARMKSIDFAEWVNLADVVDKYNPYYLPLDHPNRDDYMAALNEGLGTDFPLIWPVYGSRGWLSDIDYQELPPDEQVERLYKHQSIKDLIERIYQ